MRSSIASVSAGVVSSGFRLTMKKTCESAWSGPDQTRSTNRFSPTASGSSATNAPLG